MRLANEQAATALCVLNKCCDALEPDGAWRWRCAIQNGARLPISASLQEDFLHLECRPEAGRKDACTTEQALLGNRTLTGGVKLALNGAGRGLRLVTDILILEEKQLMNRLQLAIDGFHLAQRLLKWPASHLNFQAAQPVPPPIDLGSMLRELSWPSAERGPNEFSAELDANSAPPAAIRGTKSGVRLSVELVRSNAPAEVTRRALAVFLLTATSALRMARAYAEEQQGGLACGIEVDLPATPVAEEIGHALAALSVAHGMCARETTVLLNQAVAQCYLAARDLSTPNENQSEQEN